MRSVWFACAAKDAVLCFVVLLGCAVCGNCESAECSLGPVAVLLPKIHNPLSFASSEMKTRDGTPLLRFSVYTAACQRLQAGRSPISARLALTSASRWRVHLFRPKHVADIARMLQRLLSCFFRIECHMLACAALKRSIV